MSTEQTSTGPGDAPERRIIDFVPQVGADDVNVDELPPTDSVAPVSTADAVIVTDKEYADEKNADEEAADAVFYEDQVQPEFGILGFTLRELVIVGAWAVAFVVSFFPVFTHGASVWTSGIDWILTIGAPTVAVFLLVLRRFSPEGIRRVGSLGIDQFASVAALVAGVAWAQLLWRQVAVSIDTGAVLIGWVPIIAQVATLALIAATVTAPLIPHLREDFEGRMETLAHRNANPVRPVIRRPRPAAAVVHEALQEDSDGADDADSTSGSDGVEVEPVVETGITVAVDEYPAAESDADVTRVIDLTPASDGPGEAVAGAASAGSMDPMPREEGTAYTDPIGALHDIFGSDSPVEHSTVEHSTVETDDQTESLLRRNRNEHARNTESDPQPFWILASTERDVLDERGQPLYRIGPNAWTLVIEDRDGAYVVRHDDGRIGYLHDLTDITKG